MNNKRGIKEEVKKRYEFIGKTLFFPKEKILAIGDLHLGFEEYLRKAGLNLPLMQFKSLEKEITNIIKHIKTKYGKIEKIVLLGDLKHNFGFQAREKNELNKLIQLLEKFVAPQDIICIRGNHELNDKNGRYIDYYIFKDIAFTHGHRDYLEIYDKKINLVIMGHLHPSVTLRDEMKIRNEKYKCFLIGRHKKKDFAIVPSFLEFTEGIAANEMDEMSDNHFSIIPNEELDDFEVFIVQDIGMGALDFGKLGDLE